MKNKVVISVLGTVLDKGGKKLRRWTRWRPTVSLFQQEHFRVDRLELLHPPEYGRLSKLVAHDIESISEQTQVIHHPLSLSDPWDFEEVYDALYSFAINYRFSPETEEYYLHITTGTHVQQICWFMLAESRYIPAKLIQTNPPDRNLGGVGRYQIIDLDLSKYDRIASRFQKERTEGTTFLKGGIDTKNQRFNQMIDQKEADSGVLFLDEIGELGIDEQAMLLRAIEQKRYLPFGSDKETTSDFQLISGTNRQLSGLVAQDTFREDLLARINLWTYRLPSLKERIEDLAPNLEYEIEQFSQKYGYRISFNKAAQESYFQFANSPKALWKANFRDLNSSVTRMATLSEGGRITEAIVAEEIERLVSSWSTNESVKNHPTNITQAILGEEKAKELDRYEHYQIACIAEACQHSQSLAEAGRYLFNVSRQKKKSTNDSHRLKQILERYRLTFQDLK